jgi:hypothetical protein
MPPRHRRHIPVITAATAAIASLLLTPPFARAGVDATVVARTGDPAPGPGGGVILDFDDMPVLNTAGQVLFDATLSSPADGDGLFRADVPPDPLAPLTPLARAGQPAPAFGGGTSGAFIGPFRDITLNAAGQSAYEADTGVGASGIFRSDGSSTVALARTGQTAPGAGGGTFTDFFGTTINAVGHAAFFAATSSTSSRNGIFRSDGTSVVALARSGTAAPGNGAGTMTSLNSPSLNAAGQVAFTANINNSSTNVGIYRGGGILTALARVGDPAPGTGGGTFTTFDYNAHINDAGQVLFRGSTPAGDGIFRSDGSSTVAYLRQGQAVPNGGATFDGAWLPTSINANGHAIIRANLSTGGEGLFHATGTTFVSEYLRTGDAAPGGGTFAVFLQPYLAPSTDTVAFSGVLTGSGNVQGLFLADRTEVIQLARIGQPLGDSTITHLTTIIGGERSGALPLNDAGQVVQSVGLANGQGAVVVFTPDLRWRSDAGGPWNDNTRWTVGIRPTAVHDVSIDPANSMAISGPLTNTAVKSLTVGSGAGDVTLRLSNNITLNAGQSLSLANNGRVELSAGVLVADAVTLAAGASLAVLPGGSLATDSLTQTGGTFTGPLTLSTSRVQRYTLAGGTLAPSSVILSSSNVTFNRTGGTLTTPTFAQSNGTYTGSLTVGQDAVASYSLSGGLLAPSSLTLSTGGSLTQTGGILAVSSSVTFSGGTLTATTLANNGSLTYNSGALAGRLLNNGSVTLNADFAPSHGIDNLATLSVPLGRTLFSYNDGIDNSGSLTLAGQIAGTAPLTNNFGGSMSARGNVTAPFVNNGALSLSGVLTLSAGLTNYGTLSLGPTDNLRTNAVPSANHGQILLTGGALSGTASLSNAAGGVIQGAGSVATPFYNAGGLVHATGHLTLTDLSGQNSAGGELRVNDNASLNVVSPFSSTGTIQLLGPNALLAGGALTNTGTLKGHGRVSNRLLNAGVIQADGPLTLAGPSPTNSTTGLLKIASPAASLTYAQGLATNAGTLHNNGGSFNNNNAPLNNTGTLTGHGNFSAASWTNNNLVTFTGGPTTVDGPLTNAANRTLTITGPTTAALFTAPVTNNGTLKLTGGASATFAAGLAGAAPAAPTGPLAPASAPDAAAPAAPAGSLTLDPDTSLLTDFLAQDAVTSAGHIALLPSSQGGRPSTLATLTLLNGSTFDLADNDLTLLATPAATVRAQLAARTLRSSTPDPTNSHSLAYLYSGPPTTPSSVLVKLTLTGDANLDGLLTPDDYALLDHGYATNGSFWQQGDFNYDGQVTPADYLLLDTTFFRQAPGFSPGFLSHRESRFGPTYVHQLLTAIPEPSALACLFAVYPLLRRRKKPRTI